MPTLSPRASGHDQHEEAVAALLASYATVPPGHRVHLAKRTTNLFRSREAPGTAAGAPHPGLDVSGLTHVIAVDGAAGTADVQGMCTYEQLVAVTLRRGLVPTVVPQLRTITVGGALAGLGIESTSLRNGLPHEAVLELDVLTPDGRIVTATPHGEHADLFRAFPNSYGTLGYATRVRLRLDRATGFVATRNLRFATVPELAAAIGEIGDTGHWDGEQVDFCDGVLFDRADLVLCLGRYVDRAEARTLVELPGVDVPSDYTGQHVYYRSLRSRATDVLRTEEYLWRWDTDWFWCARALGLEHPVVRALWPRRWRRSDVYRRIVALDERLDLTGTLADLRHRPRRERVVQDVEVPLDELDGFLDWFTAAVPMLPVWLCPLRLHAPEPWPLYPMQAGRTYVNVGFWGTVPIEPGHRDGDVNRAVEDAVAAHGGHKSLYSTSGYDADTFAALYGGEVYTRVKRRYDPQGRLATLYEKAVHGA
ncbi:FAD-binding oxidoreductase [Cellulomonas hominis]